MILVTGATGTIGSLVVKGLVEAGSPVRALTRDAKRIAPTAGVEVAQGDLGVASSLESVFRGVSAVVSITTGDQLVQHDKSIVAAAKRAAVGFIAKLSVLSAGYDAHDPITEWHRQGECVLRESGIRRTVLRANAFMSNVLNWSESVRSQATVYAPFSDAKASTIAPEDIAAVAVACVQSPSRFGPLLELTGPLAISAREQVSILARKLGQSLNLVDVPGQRVAAALKGAGMNATLSDAIVDMLATAEKPFSAHVSNDVRLALGRDATPFESWITAHLERFR